MGGIAGDAAVRVSANGHWEHDPLIARLRGELSLLRLWSGREFRLRYRQSLLGVAWSVLQPAAMLVVYGAVLTSVFHVTGRGLPYLSFAFAGLVPWVFFSNSVTQGFASVSRAAAIVSKVYFARETIPLAIVGAMLIDLLIGTSILLVLAAVQHVGLGPTVVALPAVYAVFIVFVTALTVFGAMISAFIRDIALIVPLALQLVFIASPIMYPAALLPGRFAFVASVNPLVVAADNTRSVVLEHVWPDWSLLAIHGAIGCALLLLALLYTRSVEPRIPDVI